MGFSATGNLLSGSMQRPDIATLILSNEKGQSTGSKSCKLNRLGYLPVVSTISGLGRTLLGVVHTIVHLACAVFSQNRAHHLQEASLGAKNIGRGVIETIPLIGNITMIAVDLYRMEKFEKMAQEQIAKNPEAYHNQVALFIYGKEIAKNTVEKEKLMEKTTPSFEQYLEQFEAQSSTDFIPLEVQKQLLAHFEEKVRLQEISNKKASGGVVPPVMSKNLLKCYQEKVEMLKKSIQETEIDLLRLSRLNGVPQDMIDDAIIFHHLEAEKLRKSMGKKVSDKPNKDEESFEHYLKQLQTQSSVDTVPLEMQKKLLPYFEEKVRLQEISNKQAYGEVPYGGFMSYSNTIKTKLKCYGKIFNYLNIISNN